MMLGALPPPDVPRAATPADACVASEEARRLQAQAPSFSSPLPGRQSSRDTNQTDASGSSSTVGLGNPLYLHDWSVDDVVRWLASHGLHHCAAAFRENRITGDVLLDIGREDLAEMGVCALGDRMRVVKAIEQLRVDTTQVVGSAAGPSTLDFFFLGASPLVTATSNGRVRPLEIIDLEAEQHAINKALLDAGRACRFQFEFATLRRLTWATLQRSCSVLIFSGHTLPDGQWLLETETGEALAFDPYELFQHDETSAISSQGAPDSPSSAATPPASAAFAAPAPGAQLHRKAPAPAGSPTAVRAASSPAAGPAATASSSSSAPASAARPTAMSLRLVVLCSCHSCIPATLFIDAGVPHVIAVERSETVLDISARVFVQSLCHSLLVGNTIQSAFKHAQWLVKHNECLHTSGQRATAKKEAQKFVLLPEGANHATVLFPSQARGPATDCSAGRPPVQFPRTRLDLTVTRQVELWRVLRAIRHHRFVQVLGPPGVGKRTLVCLVAHYVWQRHLFPDGIHYIHVDDLRWIVALDWSFRRLFSQGGGGEDGESAASADPERAASSGAWQLYHESFLDQRLSLPGYRLLILDGCHGLYQKCRKAFMQWLSRILAENPHLQVLITARTPVRDPLGVNVAKDVSGLLDDDPPNCTVEVGDLSESDAVRLLRWRCHVLPEAAAFLEEHGARLAALCGRLPMALCVCARWLITQLPRTDPRRLLEAMEDEARRLEILQPCALVLDAAIAVLPEVLQRCLLSLARLHSNVAADVAAAMWAVDPGEAELRLDALREHHLLEVTGTAQAGLLPPAGVGPSLGVAADSLAGPPGAQAPLYRMQPLLRLHLRRNAAAASSAREGGGGGAAVPAAVGPEATARLLSGYAARIAGGLVRREEFPNVQYVLDLAGGTGTFLVLLWAVRGNRWMHNWLGEQRRARLYERALAVLAAAAPSGGAGQRGSPAAAAAPMPSDAFLLAGPGEDADPELAEAALRRMVEAERPSRPDAPWDELEDTVFSNGSNIDPTEVWGPALDDPSLPLLSSGAEVDGQALPLLAQSNPQASALTARILDPASRHRLAAEALVELAAATRSTDPHRCLRLALCAAERLSHPPSSGAGPGAGPPSAGASAAGAAGEEPEAATFRPLLADALVEFALASLALNGASSRALTTDLLDLALALGQRYGPSSLQHFRLLRLGALHALAFERDPCKAERLLKRCLELKLQKLNTWQHAEIAETLGDCGILCHVLGDLTHAESMLRTAVGVSRQLVNLSPNKLASAVVELANLFTAEEKWAEAEALYQEAIAIYRETSDTALHLYQTMNRLALLHQRCGKPELALPLLRDCLARLQQGLGGGDAAATAAVRHNLASCLMRGAGNAPDRAAAALEEACALLELALRAYRAALPTSNASLLAVERALGQCYVSLRRPNEAVPLLEGALRTMEVIGSYSVQELGKVHLLLGRARLLHRQGDQGRQHFEWVLRHPAAADALSEPERMAAEEFVAQGHTLLHDDEAEREPQEEATGGATEAALSAQPLGKGKGQEPAHRPPPPRHSEHCEPQGEPAPAFAAPAPQPPPVPPPPGAAAAAPRAGFVDVDERTLSVLNRVPYLMASRLKECLGVLPPLADAHCPAPGEPLPEPPHAPPSAAGTAAGGCSREPQELEGALVRMRAERARLEGGLMS